MSDPVQRILTALREHGHEPRKAGAGWCCRCPAHDDRNPSLSIHAGDDGRALVNCHAGCSPEAVCGAVGLRLADLFPDAPAWRNGHATKPRRGVTVTNTPRKPAAGGGFSDSDTKTYPTADAAVASLEGQMGKPEGVWTYLDHAGEPAFLAVRFPLPPDPDKPDAKPAKTFRPVSRVAGGWIVGDPPGLLPLYHLPELLATPKGSRVWVFEGEKKTGVARSIGGGGWVTTTSPHGSKSAAKADWTPVAGMDVVIVLDHDDAGEKYAADVRALALKACARSVRIVRLVDLWAGMPKGGDIVDYLNHRGGDAEAVRAEVEALAGKAESEAAATPASPKIPMYEPFPVDLLPASMRNYIRDSAKCMDADPVLIAAPALTVFAGAIGNSVRVLVKHGWTEPACTWVGVVALPGSLKTQTQGAAASPVHDAQRRADRDHDAAMAVYESALAEYDAEHKAKRGKSEPTETTTPKPVEPKRTQYLTQDATPESLVGVLANNSRGVVNLWDELGGFFGGLNRYSKGGANAGESGAAFYKSAYTGTTHTENRKGADGKGRYVRLESPLVGVAGGIQPDALRRILLKQYVEDGLASRFFWVWPPDEPGGWVDNAPVNEAVASAYATIYARLQAIPLMTDPVTEELRPAIVGLAPDARPVAKAWVEGVRERMRRAASPAIRAAWAKLKGGAFRLALVIHLTEWAESGGGDLGAISADTLLRAVTIADWFGCEGERVYAMLEESEEETKARVLADWIRHWGGAITANELAHNRREFRGDVQGARAALDRLVAAGYGEWEPVQSAKGGRPTDRFRLYSAVTVTETPPTTVENVGIGDGDGDTATDARDGWGEL